MAEVNKATRLSKAARELNVGISTIVEFLSKKGVKVDSNPNTKLPAEAYELLVQEFSSDISVKKDAEKLSLKNMQAKQESISIDDVEEGDKPADASQEEEILIKNVAEPEAAKAEALEKEKPAKEETAKKPAVEKKEEKPAEKAEEVSAEKPAKKEETPEKEKPAAKKEEPETKKATEEKKEEPAGEEKAEEKKKTGPTVVGKIDLDTVKARPKAKKQDVKEEKTAEKEVEKEKVREEKPVAEEKTEEKPAEEKKAPAAKKEEKEEKEAPADSKDKPAAVEAKKPEEKAAKEDKEFISTRVERLSGPTVVGKINLPDKPKKDDKKKKKPVASSSAPPDQQKKKRKRIRKDTERVDTQSGDRTKGKTGGRKKKAAPVRPEVNEEDVQKQIKETLARLTSKGKSKGAKHRRDKRDAFSQRLRAEEEKQEQEKNILKVTEFVTVNELATLMEVPATDVISTCMNLGLFVSINQRLDAETLVLVADEFDYQIEFISVELQEAVEDEQDDPENLKPRPPIVTVMGHVDHGKTKLLDYIRSANVVAGEAGGITQHIGAYSVELEDGRKITFLDTPGHEAFTAMRARGAQVTDIAIIVVAADDGVMPQTVEAINHAAAAGVPIVFAINKVDKEIANPEKIKEELANMNYMVEDWGGKYQSQEVSAKSGLNVNELLEKVLLEAEMLELKANPDKKATGTVVESSLDKGRGYVATILVETGTLHIGDVILAGHHFGHIKAMFNERGKAVESVGPATPVLILGLNGAPQAGDRFNIMPSDKEAKEAAIKREQLQRQQSMRTKKHITLDEIGRRIAIGNFQELNIIVKGDVDGSVEALSDSLVKLSTEEIQVNIKHKGVGAISDPDILLAAASNAIVIGFNVRPSASARKFAEKEEIDIRIYSIIYDAINEIKSAMEGMLSPEVREEVTATLDVQEVFKITKVGTIAGCMVKEGKIHRDSKVRLIRDGIVVYTGLLGSLKRFKDDAKEVVSGLECGLNIENFNDIKVGDQIEAYKEFEIQKKL